MEGTVLDGSQELLGIAQIAMGMAGFAGVAAAILLERSFQRDDQLRFLSLFAGTIAVILLSFVPLLLGHAGLVGEAIWRWASVGFLAVALAALPLGVWVVREAKRFEKMPPRWALFPQWGLFAIAPLLQLANVFDFRGGAGPVPYLIGLLCWLAAGAEIFVIIVLLRAPAGSPEASSDDAHKAT